MPNGSLIRSEKADGNETVKLELIRRGSAMPSIWPPLLFVHGGFHAAWCWDEHFLPYFAEHGLETFAISLRGHGNSEGHEGIDRWGLADYCDDLREVYGRCRTPPVLIGHSIGAVIVQQFVQSHDAAAIVMLAPTPRATMAMAKFRWALRYPVATAKMLLFRDVNCARASLRNLLFARDLDEASIDKYMARLQRESNRVFADISRIQRPNSKGIRVPALVVVAEYDRIPKKVNQRLADAFDADLVRLPIAHDMMLSPQWKLAADLIIDWIMQLKRRAVIHAKTETCTNGYRRPTWKSADRQRTTGRRHLDE